MIFNKKILNFLFIFLFVTIYIRTPYFQISHPFSLLQAKASTGLTTGPSEGRIKLPHLPVKIENFNLYYQTGNIEGVEVDVYTPSHFLDRDTQNFIRKGRVVDIRISFTKNQDGSTLIHLEGYWSTAAMDSVVTQTILMNHNIIGVVRDETLAVLWDSDKNLYFIDLVSSKKFIGHTPIPIFPSSKIPSLNFASNDEYEIEIIRTVLPHYDKKDAANTQLPQNDPENREEDKKEPIVYNKFITPPLDNNVKVIGVRKNIDGHPLIEQGSLLLKYTDDTGQKTAIIIHRDRINKIMSYGFKYIYVLVSFQNGFSDTILDALSKIKFDGSDRGVLFDQNKIYLSFAKMLGVINEASAINTFTTIQTLREWIKNYEQSNQIEKNNRKKPSNLLINALKAFKKINPYYLMKDHFFTKLTWGIILFWGIVELSSPARMTSGGDIAQFNSLISGLIFLIGVPVIGILGINAVVRLASKFSHKIRQEFQGYNYWQTTLAVTQKVYAFSMRPLSRYAYHLITPSKGQRQKRINFERYKDERIKQTSRDIAKATAILSVIKLEGVIDDKKIQSNKFHHYKQYINYILDNRDKIKPVLDRYLNPSYINVDHTTHHINVDYIQNHLSRRIESSLFKSYERRQRDQGSNIENIESFNQWLEQRKRGLGLRPYFKSGLDQLVHLTNQKKEFKKDLIRFFERNGNSLNTPLHFLKSLSDFIRHDMNESTLSLLSQKLNKEIARMVGTMFKQVFPVVAILSSFIGLRSIRSLGHSGEGMTASVADPNHSIFHNLVAHIQGTFQQISLFMILVFGTMSMAFSSKPKRLEDVQYFDRSHYVPHKTRYSFLKSIFDMFYFGFIPRFRKKDNRFSNNLGGITHSMNMAPFKFIKIYASSAILFRHLLGGQSILQAFAGTWYILVSGFWLFAFPWGIVTVGIDNTKEHLINNIKNLEQINKELNAIAKKHFRTEKEAIGAFHTVFKKIFDSIAVSESPDASIKIIKQFNKTIDRLVTFIKNKNSKLLEESEISSYINIERNHNSILKILDSLKRPLDKSSLTETPNLPDLKLGDLTVLSKIMYIFFNETKNNQPVSSIRNKDFQSVVALTFGGFLTGILALYTFMNSYKEDIITLSNLFAWTVFSFSAIYALKKLYEAPILTKENPVGWLISALFGTKTLSKWGAKTPSLEEITTDEKLNKVFKKPSSRKKKKTAPVNCKNAVLPTTKDDKS